MEISRKIWIISITTLFLICQSYGNQFSILNGSGVNIAMFDSLGNVYLKGTLDELTSHTTTLNDEFRILNEDSNDLLIIDINDGNMYLLGQVFENQGTLTPSGTNNFIIQDSNDNPVAYVDPNGNLYIKGSMHEDVFTYNSLLFSFLDSSNNNIAVFDSAGNLYLKGNLDESTAHVSNANDEFRIQKEDCNDIVIIDSNDGNMYLSGQIFENQGTLTPSGANNFIIKDSNGVVAAYIDDPNGNLYLKGALHEQAF